MVFEQNPSQQVLRVMVHRLSPEKTQEEDLFQEALIHLWLREKEHPNQSAPWYLQSCRFHLQNVIRKGRSIDSGSHRNRGVLGVGEDGKHAPAAGQDNNFFSLICARDLLSQLSDWLRPVEQQILNLSVQGFSSREIGARLGFSHTSINKHRRRIAVVASALGVNHRSNSLDQRI